MQAFKAVRRQGDGRVGGINDPAQDQLAHGPGAIAFEEFLDRGGFLPVRTIRRFERAKYLIKRMEELAFDVGPPLG